MATSTVFSDFELKKLGFKFKGTTEYKAVECIGSLEEEMEVKVITKSCRGVVKKKITKGTGNGDLKGSAHIPWDIYTEAFGMNLDTLITGVKAYGANSIHKEIALTALVEDEDGNVKYKAYPKAVMSVGKASKIKNGEEEVAEYEFEISVMPDEYGNGVYEALASELDEEIAEQWLTAFTPELVQNVTSGGIDTGGGAE